MNLKTIILNERSQTEKNVYGMVSFVYNSRKCKLIYMTASISVGA